MEGLAAGEMHGCASFAGFSRSLVQYGALSASCPACQHLLDGRLGAVLGIRAALASGASVRGGCGTAELPAAAARVASCSSQPVVGMQGGRKGGAGAGRQVRNGEHGQGRGWWNPHPVWFSDGEMTEPAAGSPWVTADGGSTCGASGGCACQLTCTCNFPAFQAALQVLPTGGALRRTLDGRALVGVPVCHHHRIAHHLM